jgi:ABC-2 type transport system ATP-binding protein
MINAPAVAVKSLTKSYRHIPALDKFTLEVPAQSILALVGPDGAGKTTLLRVLAGILDFDSGDIEIFGENYRRHFERTKASIGYMPQRFGLYEDLTVRENIDFFADLFSVARAERRERIKRLLEFSRMEPFTDRLAGKLSGGMKQKLGLACALIHNPKVLLLDEPTNGVDPLSRREFWKLLYDLNREGTTIVISSSYMDEAERASHFALMSKGVLISRGVPSVERQGFHYVVYELIDKRARLLKEQLSRESIFASVNLFGQGIHLSTEPAVTLDEVRANLAGKGIDASSLRRILPTFEDIYISLSRAKP